MKNGKTWYGVAALVTVAIFLTGAAVSAEQAAQPTKDKGVDVREDSVKGSGVLQEGKEAPDVYEVRPGDTLWDISQRELNNPWYWPKLWSLNPQISNPHTIYPGEQIRFTPAGEELPYQVETQEPQAVSKGEAGQLGVEVPEEIAERVQVAGRISKMDEGAVVYRRDSFVSSMDVERAGEIYASHDEKRMLSSFDRVYLKIKDLQSVRIGDRFMVYDKPEAVRHPSTNKIVGYQVEVAGGVRVVKINEKEKLATAEVFTSSQPMYRGYHVLPWGEGDNLRRIEARPAAVEISGVILKTAVDKRAVFGERNVVFVDKGKDDGLVEGNILNVVRSGDGLAGNYFFTDWKKKKGLPYETEATLVVVEARDKVSTCFVAMSLKELVVGDRVETRVQK